jgi:uncharacterized hydrophobic protein (TIGR00271 family)
MSEDQQGVVAPEEEEAVHCFLIHDDSLNRERLAEWTGDRPLTALPWAERESIPDHARVLLCLGDEQIRDMTALAIARCWQVAVLPHAEARHAMAALGVRGELTELLTYYSEARCIEVDALTCNDELVFSSVVMGRVLTLRPYDINRPQTGWSIFAGALKGLSKLRLAPYTVTMAKGRRIQLAALGMVALGHTQSRLVGRRFAEDLSITDGRLALLALAPRSVLSYLWFVLRLIIPAKLHLNRLPPSLGLIQSNCLHISAPQGTEYLLDGKPVHATEIEFRVLEDKLMLIPGPALKLRREEVVIKDKDSVRLNHIPADEGVRSLTGSPLPMFSHASEEEYRDLFVSLRENATASASFQVLTVLSVLLALSGLYANSAPVIIGAMILAPLMAPIISLAMGLARTDSGMIRGAINTLAVGVAWGLGCAVLLALAMPLEVPTLEMKSRMSPTLLDLLVAILSGIAGAYAHAKEEIAKSLAGVAIAVALVPPLSVAGIGLGWGDWAMAQGALLLLITNLVGIALAGAATFLVLGFAPFHRARKGLGFALVLMLAISAPLYIAFDHLVERDWISDHVPSGQIELLGQAVNVVDVRVTLGRPHIVRVVLSSHERLDERHVDALKTLINNAVGTPVIVEAQLNIRR